jgi:hypothetical protein
MKTYALYLGIIIFVGSIVRLLWILLTTSNAALRSQIEELEREIKKLEKKNST